MEEAFTCPACHASVRSSDYYCYNCGKNLKPAPPLTSLGAQIVLYLKSLLIPPFGVLWAIPYIKQADIKSKAIGAIAIALTIVSLIATIWLTKSFADNLSNQLNGQMTEFGTF